ncbi:signal peptide protein [Aquimarina atlantica]|uniref:Signal peptide protein n=1 Tax=Aquimarina atlantica TaxID=1317122 RepID=A0A023C119_9FLAO|nr:hypothetical protein [Aquimarina atlantica]EZH76007.1 signal peptide protein [Aquimarina atlantica]
MNSILKNILAVIAGWLGGSIINIALVKIGHKLIPIKGIDPNDMDALAAVMPSLGFEHFIFPFLAHALGTLVGATIAGLIAASHKMKFSLGIGGLFFLGGIMVNYMLPGPTWFAFADIAIAYIPMAWIGGKIALKIIRQ